MPIKPEISTMFKHKGKTASMIGKKMVDAYSELYNYITEKQDSGELPFSGDYLNGNELAKNIYEKKYFLKNQKGNPIEQQPEDTFKRVASFIASVEPTKNKKIKWAERFYHELFDGRFLPGGRVIAGAGDIYRLKTLANCFVTEIAEDDIDSIYKTAFECARTYSYGGGIGVDISSLRPKDAIVHNAADSSTGAVSFMDLYSLTTGLIGQSGRRGALMLTIDVKHPDIFHFIKAKQNPNWVTKQVVEQCKWAEIFTDQQLREIEKRVMENTQIRFANISIKASDEFMQAVNEQKEHDDHVYIVYKKFNREIVKNAPQNEKTHYSVGIPSKNPKEYEIAETFDSFSELNNWIFQNYGLTINEEDFLDPRNRDVFGDHVFKMKDCEFDLAIRQAGDFLLYFSSTPSGEIRNMIKARDIWDLFIEGNYRTAEPGLIFWSTMTDYSPSNFLNRPIISTNPCAEVPLEDGGACNLGSINLSRFVTNGFEDNAQINWDQLAETTRVLVRFLDNVVKWNEQLNALEKQRIAASESRRLGIGIMGIADMMNQLSISYDSDQGIETMKKVMAFITNAAYQTSAGLAEEKGPSPIFNSRKYSLCPFVKEALSLETRNLIRDKGLRNIAIMSIAPTGTISNIILGYQNDEKNYIGVSGGIEPVFALYYTRRSESFGNQLFKVFHSTVQAYIDKMDIQDAVNDADDITSVLPDWFARTAHNIDPVKRVEIQSICQQYVDHSISSTVNLPEDIEPEVISDIYLKAWKCKLKGITIYRDGSRLPILATETKISEFQKIKASSYELTLPNGTQTQCKGDEIIKLPGGSLTTVYHYLAKYQGKIQEVFA